MLRRGLKQQGQVEKGAWCCSTQLAPQNNKPSAQPARTAARRVSRLLGGASAPTRGHNVPFEKDVGVFEVTILIIERTTYFNTEEMVKDQQLLLHSALRGSRVVCRSSTQSPSSTTIENHP